MAKRRNAHAIRRAAPAHGLAAAAHSTPKGIVMSLRGLSQTNARMASQFLQFLLKNW
jgi:hypothetical protein